MPIHQVHLAQTATARGADKSVGTSAKDAQVINGLFEVSENPLLGTKTVYLTKRSGSTFSSSIGTTGQTVILKVRSVSLQNDLYVSGTTPTLFSGSASLGAIDAVPGNNLNVCESVISDNRVHAFAAGGSGWFLYEDASEKNFPTFSASIASGQATMTGMASTGGVYDGQLLSGSGIPAGTRVSDILDTSRLLMSQAATETGSKTITKEAVAKIIASAVSSLSVGSIETLDGYFFLSGSGSNNNTIYQSALNDPASWDSGDTVSADLTGEGIRCLFRVKDYIVAAGTSGVNQYFYNAGNATGSVLSPADNLTIDGLIIDSAPVFLATGGYFVASDMGGDVNASNYALYRLTGVNEVTKVSDGVWSEIISKRNGPYDCVNTGIINGKPLIILNVSFSAPNAVSIVYDTTVNQFTLLQLASGSLTSSWGVKFTKESDRSVFLWTVQNTWTDADAAYTMTMQTEPQDPGQGLDTTDTWADLVADTEASGTTTIDVTDDDYQNWVNKGSFDMTKNKKRVNALGFHQGARAYRLQHSANTGWRGQILRINFQPSGL